MSTTYADTQTPEFHGYSRCPECGEYRKGDCEECDALTCPCGHAQSQHQRWTPNLVSGLTEIKYTSCLECDCEEYR